MPEEKPELVEILARLERVEKENRRLRLGGFVAFLGCAMLILTGQAVSNVQAQNAEIKARSVSAQYITLIGEDGAARAQLQSVGDMTTFHLLTGPQGASKTTLGMVASRLGPSLFLYHENGGQLVLDLRENGPTVHLKDVEGYVSELGSTSTVVTRTGETHNRSAASLVFFGKDKKVLWSAP